MISWNFSRPELAEYYLNMFAMGLFSNLAIIAPRRKGKTFFILQDLAPLAQKHKYIPIYANLWQNTNAPHEGLITALEEALDVLSKKSTLSRLLNVKVKKATLGNELLGTMEIEFADSPTRASSKDLALLEQLLQQLEKKAGKKTILLLIDEVQHLATSSVFDPLTYCLRTIIDKRQGRIKTIFTGSSRHYMDLLLNESNAPFYHFVERVPFPDLNGKFIQFIADKLKLEFAIKLTTKELSTAFIQLDKSPYWMIKLIGNLVTFSPGFKDSLSYITQLIEETEGFETISKRLKPIDKLVYIALTNNENIFSKRFLSIVGKKTNVKGIPANVQRSLTRLMEHHLVSQVHKGEYHIEKAGLKHYLEDKQ